MACAIVESSDDAIITKIVQAGVACMIENWDDDVGRPRSPGHIGDGFRRLTHVGQPVRGEL